MSRPNVADWQYLGVDKFTLGLEWNCGRKARKGHICEDTFAYGSYSSKDGDGKSAVANHDGSSRMKKKNFKNCEKGSMNVKNAMITHLEQG